MMIMVMVMIKQTKTWGNLLSSFNGDMSLCMLLSSFFCVLVLELWLVSWTNQIYFVAKADFVYTTCDLFVQYTHGFVSVSIFVHFQSCNWLYFPIKLKMLLVCLFLLFFFCLYTQLEHIWFGEIAPVLMFRVHTCQPVQFTGIKYFFFHYFEGIWLYWKMNTGKHNFHEILFLF